MPTTLPPKPNDIAVGDLVMVVRPMPCCGNRSNLGDIFKVVELSCSTDDQCRDCLDDTLSWDAWTAPRSTSGGPDGHPMECLIKLDPNISYVNAMDLATTVREVTPT